MSEYAEAVANIDNVRALVDAIRNVWRLQHDTEVTVATAFAWMEVRDAVNALGFDLPTPPEVSAE
jgi:hypothetical protein